MVLCMADELLQCIFPNYENLESFSRYPPERCEKEDVKVQ